MPELRHDNARLGRRNASGPANDRRSSAPTRAPNNAPEQRARTAAIVILAAASAISLNQARRGAHGVDATPGPRQTDGASLVTWSTSNGLRTVSASGGGSLAKPTYDVPICSTLVGAGRTHRRCGDDKGRRGDPSSGVGGRSVGVARSRPLYYRDVHNGRNEFWADEFAGNRTHADATDSFRYLAKVRVAGSNPVVRSQVRPLLRGSTSAPADGSGASAEGPIAGHRASAEVGSNGGPWWPVVPVVPVGG